jgi:outer membrane protein assembly factor BamB
MVALVGCSPDKEPLEGKRVDALAIADATDDLPKVKKPSGLRPPAAKTLDQWTQAFVTASNVRPHLAALPGKRVWQLSEKAFEPDVWRKLQTKTGLQEAWSFSEGLVSDGYVLSTALVQGEHVFCLGGNGFVYGLNLKTGKEVWSTDVLSTPDDRRELLGGGLLLHNSVLYATSSLGDVVALSATDGKVVWRRSLGAPLRTAPKTSIDGRTLFVVTTQNQTLALNIRDGSLLWSHLGIPEGLQYLGTAVPAVTKEALTTCYSSGEVVRLDTKTGRVLWSHTVTPVSVFEGIEHLTHVVAAPVEKDGRLYVVSMGGKTLCLEAFSGKVLWEVARGGAETPLVFGDDLFMVTHEGMLLRLEAKTGHLVWSYDLNRAQTGDDKEVQRWLNPLMIDGVLYVLSAQGRLVAVRAKDGSFLSQLIDFDEPCVASPAVGDGKLIVTTQRGEVFAFCAHDFAKDMPAPGA